MLVTKPMILGALTIALSTAAPIAASMPGGGSHSQSLAPETVNDPGVGAEKSSIAAVLRAQILLDRAHFSPGEIDGGWGSNTGRALAGFQVAHGLETTGKFNTETWTALNEDVQPVLISYTLTPEDVAGPFEPIPEDMEAKSQLASLGYTSLAEALGERFHASPALLKQLNPDAAFEAGTEIVVPNVATLDPLTKADKVVVDKSDATVSLINADGKAYAQFPATMGSSHDPLPLGDWKILGVARNPKFHFNPELFWDAEATDAKATIAAGPNNPVGMVWVDLSKSHYGIHGTPVPATIGKTESHGCIRLTNWDALALAAAVAPGTKAILQE